MEWSNAEDYPGYVKWTALAYQMMINEVVYTLTHLSPEPERANHGWQPDSSVCLCTCPSFATAVGP